MPNPRNPSETNHINEIRKAIDVWSERLLGVGNRPEHAALAESIYQAVKHNYRLPASQQAILLDVNKHDEYCNPRIVAWLGDEETLWPVDPETDEPVEEAAAAFAFPLPRQDAVPDL